MSNKNNLGGFLACAALLFPLSACTTSDTSQYANLVGRVFQGGTKLTRSVPAGISYASIGVQLGDGNQALFVLGTARGGELDWYSGNNVMIATRSGRIVETAGLPYNVTRLIKLSPGTVTVTAGNDAPDTGEPYRLQLDFQDLGLFGITAICTAKDNGPSTIELLGANLVTNHIIEHCKVRALDWSFDNEYWRDSTSGFIWRSTQTVHPKLASITIEIFRPAVE